VARPVDQAELVAEPLVPAGLQHLVEALDALEEGRLLAQLLLGAGVVLDAQLS